MRYFRVHVYQGVALVLSLFLMLAGCGGNEGDTKSEAQKGPSDIGTSQEGQLAAKANNRMAFDLFSKMNEARPNKNIFFSPFSISHAIGMTLEGANKKTATQIRKALHIPDQTDSQKYHRGMAYIFHLLQQKDDSPEAAEIRKSVEALKKELAEVRAEGKELEETRSSMSRLKQLVQEEEVLVEKLNHKRTLIDDNECLLTNSIWVESSYVFSPKYLRSLSQHYGAETAFPADFSSSPNAERERINRWISERTHSKINDVLSPGTIDKLTRFVLVNTIYFNGQWMDRFHEEWTKPEDFHLDAKDTIKVPTMSQYAEQCRYAAFNADGSYFKTPRDDAMVLKEDTPEDQRKYKSPGYPDKKGFYMAEMPYSGDRLSMVVVAPLSYDGLPRLEKLLTADRFYDWVEKLEKRPVRIYVPTFKMQNDFDLIPFLSQLGMLNAFVMPSQNFKPEKQADFSPMLESGIPELYIGLVIHDAFLEVNEKGTEATAATICAGWTMAAEGSGSHGGFFPFVPVFKADRPFLFFICDRKLKTILFMGRVMRP